MLLSHSAASTFIEKAARVFSGSRRLPLGLESRAVSALVAKDAPFRPWSRNLRYFHVGRKNSAPSLPWSQKLCRPYRDRESRAVSTSVAKLLAELFGCENLELANICQESLDIPKVDRDISVAPSLLRSRKSLGSSCRFDYESLEKTNFGRERLDTPNFGRESLDVPKVCVRKPGHEFGICTRVYRHFFFKFPYDGPVSCLENL